MDNDEMMKQGRKERSRDWLNYKDIRTPQEVLDSPTLRDIYDFGKVIENEVRTYNKQSDISKAFANSEHTALDYISFDRRRVSRLFNIKEVVDAYGSIRDRLTELLKNMSATDENEVREYFMTRDGRYTFEEFMEKLKK